MTSSTHVAIVDGKVDTASLLKSIKQPEDGAAVVFEGIVRNHTRNRRTLYLDYEGYEEMAVKQMKELAERALADFKIRDVVIVHRLGRLEIGETSVLIIVASAHRAAAFDACRWLIDTLKRTVPIWKKEHFEDGAIWADGEPFPEDIPTGRGHPFPAACIQLNGRVRAGYRYRTRRTESFLMKRAATAGLALVLCLASAAQDASQDSDTTFKVDVKLVNVFVTVTDQHGAPIAGLKKENFELAEDDKAQKIALFDKESALPLNIVMAIDTSLSTRKDLPLEQASARRFVHAILRPRGRPVSLFVQRNGQRTNRVYA